MIRQIDDGYYWKGNYHDGGHIMAPDLSTAVMFGEPEMAFRFLDEEFVPDEDCVCIVLGNGHTRRIRRPARKPKGRS